MRIPTALRRALDAFRPWRSWFHGFTIRPLAPGILAIAFSLFLLPLIRLELKEPLFGDTLVFQYTGWCIRHGLRLYRDVGMADGPFIHYLHAAIQVFAGVTDRAFRKWDLLLQLGGSAAIGALLAPTEKLSRFTRFASRTAWAAMAATVWIAWYLGHSWTETTEREVYYSLFGLLGMVLVYVSNRWTLRPALVAMFVGGFLTTTQAFGKPTGVMYPAMGLLSVLLPDTISAIPRFVRWRTFLAGAGVCILTVLLALLVSGSVRGYLFWCWKIPYVGNRYLFGVEWLKLVFGGWDAQRNLAIIALISGTTAIAAGLLPMRALGFVLIPPIAFLGACLQGRGYAYQVIPVTASFQVLLLVALASLWEHCGDAEWWHSRSWVASLALSFVGYYCWENIQASPYRWNGTKAMWDAPATQHFADEEKLVGKYLKDHTKPTDQVFAYSAGENAHVVLFHAERRTASPFFHSFWLDPIDLIPYSEVKPGPKELAALVALQTEIQGVACTAVERNEPAAISLNLLEQTFRVCPNIKRMLADDYEDSTTIGSFHVYLRKSLHAAARAEQQASP